MTDTTREPQYQSYLEQRECFGATRLGLMTGYSPMAQYLMALCSDPRKASGAP